MSTEDMVGISIVLADWLKVFRLGLYLCQHVLTRHNSDISIRRTQGFDILMLVLMSRSSSLAHKLFILIDMLASQMRTELYLNDTADLIQVCLPL